MKIIEFGDDRVIVLDTIQAMHLTINDELQCAVLSIFIKHSYNFNMDFDDIDEAKRKYQEIISALRGD